MSSKRADSIMKQDKKEDSIKKGVLIKMKLKIGKTVRVRVGEGHQENMAH